MSDPKIGNEVWLVPVGIFAAGFGAGAFRQLPAWAATLLVMAGAVLIFGVIIYTMRRAPPAKTPEQIGADVYGGISKPLVVTISLELTPEQRATYMRLAAKKRGKSSDEKYMATLGRVVTEAVDDYLERHE